MKEVKLQKMHKHGLDGNRYFWKVSGSVQGEYRSRHSSPEGVKTELRRYGHTVTSVAPVLL